MTSIKKSGTEPLDGSASGARRANLTGNHGKLVTSANRSTSYHSTNTANEKSVKKTSNSLNDLKNKKNNISLTVVKSSQLAKVSTNMPASSNKLNSLDSLIDKLVEVTKKMNSANVKRNHSLNTPATAVNQQSKWPTMKAEILINTDKNKENVMSKTLTKAPKETVKTSRVRYTKTATSSEYKRPESMYVKSDRKSVHFDESIRPIVIMSKSNEKLPTALDKTPKPVSEGENITVDIDAFLDQLLKEVKLRPKQIQSEAVDGSKSATNLEEPKENSSFESNKQENENKQTGRQNLERSTISQSSLFTAQSSHKDDQDKDVTKPEQVEEQTEELKPEFISEVIKEEEEAVSKEVYEPTVVNPSSSKTSESTHIPNKAGFKNEFVSCSKQRILIPPSSIQQSAGMLLQPEIVKPEGWLGFRVSACGTHKGGRPPVPKSNFFIERGHFGDDAGFWSENLAGDAIGIADGATGNRQLGYDPGDFSRELMKYCAEIFTRESDCVFDAKALLVKAFDDVQEKTTVYGSCTSCVLTLDHRNNRLTAANVGDSGYCVLRNGKIVQKSEPQRITFECPKQLDNYPWKEKSRKMGVSFTDIFAKDTELEEVDIMKGDLIIVSSDGLYDNCDFHEIEEICLKSKTLSDLAHNLVHRSLKNNYKPDDIIVLVAKVVDDKQSSPHQKFSQAPIDSDQ